MADLAVLIADARRSGGEIDAPPPLTLGEGYRVAERLRPLLGTAIGWKVGATSPGGQAALGTGEPILGRLFAQTLHRAPAEVRLPGQRPAEAEPEIVLEVGPGGSLAAAFLGVEVNRPSRTDALALGAGFVVADNAAHAALVLGPALPLAALDDPAALAVTLRLNGTPAGQGSAAAVLGDPRRSLAWLAGQVEVRAGDLVATGAMCRPVPLHIGDRVEADFGGFGRVLLLRREAEVMAGPC